VVIDLLIRTSAHAHAPAAALVLVDEYDAVFLALIDRARGTARHARRIQAVLTQPRQVHHERVFELPVDVFLYVFEVLVFGAFAELTAQDLFPVRTPYNFVHGLAGDQTAR